MKFHKRSLFFACMLVVFVFVIIPMTRSQNEVLFSTLESEFIYLIKEGRANPIEIESGSPPPPASPPTAITPDYGNLVIKWNLNRKRNADGAMGVDPQFVRVWLFKPKASVSDIMTILDPPEYPGHGAKGHYLLRYPEGDDTYPKRQDTPLWQEYIEPNWELVPGAEFRVTDANVNNERDNAAWPGARRLAQWKKGGGSPWIPVPIPLRVAVMGLGKEEALLALLEIKRFGRLRLYARPMLIKPTIHSDIDPSRCGRMFSCMHLP